MYRPLTFGIVDVKNTKTMAVPITNQKTSRLVLLVLRNTMFEGVLLNNRSLALFTSAGDLWIPLCMPAVEGGLCECSAGSGTPEQFEKSGPG